MAILVCRKLREEKSIFLSSFCLTITNALDFADATHGAMLSLSSTVHSIAALPSETTHARQTAANSN